MQLSLNVQIPAVAIPRNHQTKQNKENGIFL